MKLKRLKRGLSALLAGLIAVSSVGITSVVFANAQSEILKYHFIANGYEGLGLSNPLYVANANDLSNIENVTIPEVYDDGTNGSAMVAFASLSPYNTGVVNYSVKTVKVNTTVTQA